MMYTIDCEFDGYQGALISCAIYREDGESLYIHTLAYSAVHDPWVQKNVIPIMFDCPIIPKAVQSPIEASQAIYDFIKGDEAPTFIADWPVDIQWLCELLITGPGTMVDTPFLVQMMIIRIDAYETTTITEAVRHNAWWDAKVLMDAISTQHAPVT